VQTKFWWGNLKQSVIEGLDVGGKWSERGGRVSSGLMWLGIGKRGGLL